MRNRVLIVDDDLALRPFWEIILRRQYQTYKYDWAVSVEEAKTLFRNSNFNNNFYSIIIIDLFLSGSETGLDLIDFFETQLHTPPLVLVTAVDNEKLQKEVAQKKKKVFLLQKPLSIPSCERLLEELLMNSNTINGGVV